MKIQSEWNLTAEQDTTWWTKKFTKKQTHKIEQDPLHFRSNEENPLHIKILPPWTRKDPNSIKGRSSGIPS
jgi:hypothetical protein